MTPSARMLPPHLGISIVVACYLLLGAFYAIATPTFEASDELRHYMYVKQLVDGRGLPVQTPQGDNPALQEASQPPLYYLLAAASILWLDTGPLEQTYTINPHAMLGVPSAPDNKNMVIHGQEERFPWQGPVLAVRILRLLSLLLGAATLMVTWAVARELLPGRPDAALGAAAIVAFVPQFLFIGASASNDNLVTVLGALALLLTIQITRPHVSRRQLVLLGFVCGLAALAKVSGLLALPLALAAVVWRAWQARSSRQLFAEGVLVIVPAILAGGWWYARNWLLYGDPLGLTLMVSVAGGRPPGFSLIDLIPELEGLRWSFWAAFGGFNIIPDRWVYWVYDLITAMAALGIAIAFARLLFRRSSKTGSLPVPSVSQLPIRWLLALLWSALLLAALARWSLTTMGSAGRLLFPAMPVTAALLFTGLAACVPRKWPRDRVALAISVPLLAVLACYLPFATIMPTYIQPPLVPSSQATAVPNPLLAVYDGQIELMGYSVDRRAAQAGGTVLVDLYWQTLAPMDRDLSLFVHLYGANGATAGQVDTYPGGGAYATSRLPAGVVLRDTLHVRISPTAAPGIAQIAAGLADLAKKTIVEARDGQGRPVDGAIALGELRILSRDEAALSGAVLVGANLGDQVALAAYDLPVRSVRPGDSLRGTLYWRALARPAHDYTVFVHLLGPNGPLAQHDAVPLGGQYPTRDWAPDDLIADSFAIQLPAVSPGEYALVAGMYQLQSGQRLPVRTGLLERLAGRLRPGDAPPDAISLGKVRIGGP